MKKMLKRLWTKLLSFVTPKKKEIASSTITQVIPVGNFQTVRISVGGGGGSGSCIPMSGGGMGGGGFNIIHIYLENPIRELTWNNGL